MKLLLSGIISVLLFSSSFSRADIIVRHKITSFFPAMSITSSQTITEFISADNGRFEEATEVSSPFLAVSDSAGKKIDHPSPMTSVELYKLDKGMNWYLTPERKFYDEFDLASRKKSNEESTSERQTPDDSLYTWIYRVNSMDSLLTICGYRCQGIIGFAIGFGIQNPSDTVVIVSRQWRTDSIPGIQEAIAFHTKLAELGGGDATWTRSSIDGFDGQLKRLSEEMNKFLPGYPMKIDFLGETLLLKNGKLEYNQYPYSDEVTSIEQKSIEKNLFELPSDYKVRK